MPTYRVYYAERDTRGHLPLTYYESREARLGMNETGSYSETEWEEEVEARDAAAALEAFFREHVRDRSDVRCVDGGGEPRPVDGWSYEPEKTYIWIENDRLMEYQGIDEATPGMVACPLCDGDGEIAVELANAYLGGLGQEILEEG